MAELFFLKVFDGYITNSSASYTVPDFNEPLGEADALVIHVIIDSFQAPMTSLVLQVEHSSDGLWWQSKNVSPEISGTNPPGIPAAIIGYELGTNPSLGLVRLRMAVTYFGGGNGRTNLIVYVAGRQR